MRHQADFNIFHHVQISEIMRLSDYLEEATGNRHYPELFPSIILSDDSVCASVFSNALRNSTNGQWRYIAVFLLNNTEISLIFHLSSCSFYQTKRPFSKSDATEILGEGDPEAEESSPMKVKCVSKLYFSYLTFSIHVLFHCTRRSYSSTC